MATYKNREGYTDTTAYFTEFKRYTVVAFRNRTAAMTLFLTLFDLNVV